MSRHTSKTTRVLIGAAGVSSAALLLAACGGGGGYGAAAPKSHSNPAASQTITSGNTSAGTTLVDSQGRTLYVFAADSPGTSRCTGSCSTYWPPELVAGPVGHSSAVTAALGTIKRSDGKTQLTVNGWPAYTYVGDSAPGQAAGQGKNLSGGLWWVVSPSGTQIKSGGSGTGYSGGNGTSY